MVRETRHLWVGNLPDNIQEDRIKEYFKRFGRVQSVKILSNGGGVNGAGDSGNSSSSADAATVAFMDITSACKAHSVEHSLDDRVLRTSFYDPSRPESGPGPGGGSNGPMPRGSGGVQGPGVNSPSVQARLHGGVDELRSSHVSGGYYTSRGNNGGRYEDFPRHPHHHRSNGSGAGSGPGSGRNLYRNSGPYPSDSRSGGGNNPGYRTSSSYDAPSRIVSNPGSSSSSGGPALTSSSNDFSYLKDSSSAGASPAGSTGSAGSGSSGRRGGAGGDAASRLNGHLRRGGPSGGGQNADYLASSPRLGKKPSTAPGHLSRRHVTAHPGSHRSPLSTAGAPGVDHRRGGGGADHGPSSRDRLGNERTRSSDDDSGSDSSSDGASDRDDNSSGSDSNSSRSSSASSTRSRSPRASRPGRHAASGRGARPVAPPSSSASSSLVSSGQNNKRRLGTAPAKPVDDSVKTSCAILVRNLPARPSDLSLQTSLYHEYQKRMGLGVLAVRVAASGRCGRFAVIYFSTMGDVNRALERTSSANKAAAANNVNDSSSSQPPTNPNFSGLLAGAEAEVFLADEEVIDDKRLFYRPSDSELDEFHPRATRSLYAGNLPKEVVMSDLHEKFGKCGEILEIDLNKRSYALIQFDNVTSVVKAIKQFDGEPFAAAAAAAAASVPASSPTVSAGKLKLAFGGVKPTKCVWCHGFNGEVVTEKVLSQEFGRFGKINDVLVNRARGTALVYFDQTLKAQRAVLEMRGRILKGSNKSRIQTDYASHECRAAFFEQCKKAGMDVRRRSEPQPAVLPAPAAAAALPPPPPQAPPTATWPNKKRLRTTRIHPDLTTLTKRTGALPSGTPALTAPAPPTVRTPTAPSSPRPRPARPRPPRPASGARRARGTPSGRRALPREGLHLHQDPGPSPTSTPRAT